MPLIPKLPPGRINRKARAFEQEIARLRSEGYTCEAIRVALADVGMVVSLSTVQREARRPNDRPRPCPKPLSPIATGTFSPTAASAPLASSIRVGDPRTGKQFSHALFSSRITNSLLRNQEQS